MACHGGDASQPDMEAMDPAKGYIGKPHGPQIAQVCGRCHSDAQFMKRYNPSLPGGPGAEYATSWHGRRLRERGDPKGGHLRELPSGARASGRRRDPNSTVHPLKVADTCGRCHADAKFMGGLPDRHRSAREVQEPASTGRR